MEIGKDACFEDRAVEHAEKEKIKHQRLRRKKSNSGPRIPGSRLVRTLESTSRQGADGGRKKETGKERRIGGNERQ